jgi:phage terminase small subunit
MLVGVDKELDDKVEVFVLEYCNHFNGTRAAKQAGYSEDTAYDTAWRLLRKPEVQRAIESELKKRARALKIEGADIIFGISESIRRAAEKGDEKAVMKGYEMLAKWAGLFERDNKQKAGVDPERAKQLLRERGIDIDKLKPPCPEPSEN